jgi:hypothetical protein
MTIGTQGCNFQTMLALNGVDTGRVVYIDQDLRKPSFAAEMSFFSIGTSAGRTGCESARAARATALDQGK